MNENIKSLLNVCGMPNEDLMELFEDKNKTFYMEKFAELILNEAMDIVRDEVSFFSDWACADNAVTKVKTHFGIE